MKKTYLIGIALMTTIGVQAQTVLTVKADATAISVADAGSYDYVNDEWAMEKGKTYLVSLPAALDGCYFGPQAKRQKVSKYTKQQDGSYVVTVSDMADIDDFNAGDSYIITPDIEVKSITHIIPGVKTNIKATAEGKELIHDSNVTISTGINTIESELLQNNSVNTVYDLQGRKVSSMSNGQTYIINGKKITIK